MHDNDEVVMKKEDSSMLVQGKIKIGELLKNGNISSTLHQVSDWTRYIQEAVNALEKIAENTREILSKQGSSEEGSQQQPALAVNPALFVNLLKTQEFQQVIAMFMVQFLKNT